MRSFFPYHGSKNSLAKTYGQPLRKIIVEPFAGSAGYSTYWEPEKAVLIEKNELIAGIWQWLIKSNEKDVMALPENATGVDELKGFPEEAKNWVGMWFSRGSTGPRPNIAKANLEKKARGESSIWGPGVQKRIAKQIHQIDNWEIIIGNYDEAPDIEAHWHIDPPYQTMGCNYRHNGDGIDFQHLGNWCRSRKGAGEVCEAGNPDWLPFEKFREVTNQKNDIYCEMIWEFGKEKGITSSLLSYENE